MLKSLKNFIKSTSAYKNNEKYTKMYRENFQEISEETRRLQLILWSTISAVTVTYCVVCYFGNYAERNKLFSQLMFICIGLVIYSIFVLFLFKYRFNTNWKCIIPFAYFNITLILLVLEWQYLFGEGYLSYTLYICIVMLTPIMVIGPTFRYTLIISSIFIIDTIYMGFAVYMGEINEIIPYALDILITILTTSALNYFISITKIKEADAKSILRKERDTDQLTQLLNRNAIEKIICEYPNTNDFTAMLILDIDGFKQINDTYGHFIGDEMLRKIGGLLGALKKDGDYISRLGGDEFLIFVTKSNVEDVRKQAKKIIEGFQLVTDNLSDLKDIQLSCSIGVSYSSEVADKNNLFSSLYFLSDKRLYDAKRNGKNKYIDAV